ncbi:MAG: prepilin-type N-terminal cleavage/methylation domain-containing protein [Patescibacteria group bacterium]
MKIRKGFTLVEILIAVSIFTLAIMLSSRVLVDIVRLEKTSSVTNSLYADARTILQQLTNEIQAGTVDYEEYYSINVVQDGDEPKYYGINYGVYASRFFDPGKSQYGAATNPEDLGIECSYPADVSLDCEIYYSHSSDLNTGQNPYSGDVDDADAFCDDVIGNEVGKCDPLNKNIVSELYLIDSAGTQKTIIGRRLMSGDDYALAMVRMKGEDLDQNGIVDVFKCTEDYSCEDDAAVIAEFIKYKFITDMGSDAQDYLELNGISLPQNTDLEDDFKVNQSQFIPTSPIKSTIKNLKFIINPLEDPYKAYAEHEFQTHPTVTILLTVGLSEAAAEEFPGEFKELTLQTTVTAGVIGRIDSYPPVDDVLRSAGDASWVDDVLP